MASLRLLADVAGIWGKLACVYSDELLLLLTELGEEKAVGAAFCRHVVWCLVKTDVSNVEDHVGWICNVALKLRYPPEKQTDYEKTVIRSLIRMQVRNRPEGYTPGYILGSILLKIFSISSRALLARLDILEKAPTTSHSAIVALLS